MNEFANEKIRGLNGSKIIRQDTTKYRSHNYFQVNPHVRMLAQLFQKSPYLSQFREMLFLSLQQIYLRTNKLLTVLQWMQPPIMCYSKQKRDQQYLKIIQYAQQTRQLGIVPEQIYIIEIERFLKVLQNDNKEITLKLLFEICDAMSCIIKGKQEFVLYDKFFAYLFHQFNSTNDFVQMSLQQREFLKKYKEEQKLNKINKYGLRRVGQISILKHEFFLEEQQQDVVDVQVNQVDGNLNLKLSNSNFFPEKSPQATIKVDFIQDQQKDYYNMNADNFYDSVKNLIQCKGGTESLNYKFIGMKFNLKENLSLNAIYQNEEDGTKLFLHSFQLFSGKHENQNTLTKYLTLQSMVNNNKIDQVENLQDFLQQSPPQSPHQSNFNIKTETIHQQTISNEEMKVEFEVSNQNEFELDGGLELNFCHFDPQTLVQFQVYSVNSECVAGIKISFPEERSSFPLIQFPCLEPFEGGYDCHSYQFKPLSNLKGCQIELVEITPNQRFIKNFMLLVQDSDNLKDINKLKHFQFDFAKNQEMGDIQNLHDQIMPYFTDDWRKVKFPLYVNFQYSHIPQQQQVKIESQLKKISLVINSMFPNVEYLENKRRLINPNIFEMYVQGLGRHKNRDQYERTVFIQIEDWQQILEERVIDNILDNIIIFIWSGGLEKSRQK